jgi:hypothetical protein
VRKIHDKAKVLASGPTCAFRARRRADGPPFTLSLPMIRVVLPEPLCVLTRIDREVTVEVEGPATQRAVIEALEAEYPVLRGTIRDHATHRRRAYLRFFACGLDLSHEAPDAPLPEAVAEGREPFLVVGAMAGG